MTRKSKSILIAEDDHEDRLLIEEAFNDIGMPAELQFVEDGQGIMNELKKSSKFDLPSFIMLDLNLPKKNGYEVLKELKQDDRCKTIPVIIFSTSSNTEDINLTYQLGASSFITKPSYYSEMVDSIKKLSDYYFEISKLPVIS